MEYLCLPLGIQIVSIDFFGYCIRNKLYKIDRFYKFLTSKILDTDVIEDNAIDALRKALLMNIEKYEVPKIDEDSYTDIEISTKIVHVEIEEDKGAMNVHGFLKMVSIFYL